MRIHILILVIMTLGFTACSSDNRTKKEKARDFLASFSQNPLYSIYYDLEKVYTERGGGWIIVEDDYGIWAVNIFTINLIDYNSYEEYFINESIRIDSTYTDGSGIQFYVDVHGHHYSADKDSQKDLFKVKSQMEKMALFYQGKDIANEFGLSEKRGIEVAQIASQYKKILSNRSITEADLRALSKTVLGVDISQIDKAIEQSQQGDESEFDNLIIQASGFNGSVSPEIFRKGILKHLSN